MAPNVIFVGGSGTGKTTFSRLLEERNGYKRIRTWSTNVARYGGHDADYLGVETQQFEAAWTSGRLYNRVLVGGWWYGIQRDFASELDGSPGILHLVMDWAVKVQADFPNMVIVLLQTPSIDEQRRRLALRGDSLEVIDRRLADAAIQSPPSNKADLVLVNETDNIDGTYGKLVAFLGL